MHAVETMMHVGAIPWRGLGRQFETPPETVLDGLVAAGLDWRVGLKALATVDGEPVTHRATYRESDGSILGVVGPRYHPLQNIDAFSTFQPFLDSGKAELHTAGSLFGGRRVWILARIVGDPDEIVPGDPIERYILLSHGHDGSLAIHYGLTPIRVVCANTEALARGHEGSSLLRIKHTAGAGLTLERATDLISTANNRFEATIEQYRWLATRKVSARDLERYVKVVVAPGWKDGVPASEVPTRTANRVAKVLSFVSASPGAQYAQGTWWQAYNGISYHLSHDRGRTADARLDSLWFGAAANDNADALEVALKMAA